MHPIEDLAEVNAWRKEQRQEQKGVEPKPPTKSRDVPLNPFAQAVLGRVYKNTSFLNPDVCGGGVFLFRGGEASNGVVKGGFYPVVATLDSRSGNSLGYLYEGGIGPVSVGRETAVNTSSGQVQSSTLVFLGAGAGALVVPGRNQIGVGLYFSAGVVGGGAYVNLVPSGACKQ
jgi:hypothetical protein